MADKPYAEMDRKQIRKPRIEIPLSSKPRPYRPGDGPALSPLRIALENDSNAFILDRRVLPGTTVHGELKLQMYYVVGWPDLPGARVSVSATKIYDYVSPRTLEDYEYNCSLEIDRQREIKEATEKQKAERAAKMKVKVTATSTSTSTNSPMPNTPLAPGQKKRGRPSKAELQARRLAQQASYNSDEAQNIEMELPPASITGPSLSTPQKKYTAELATDMEDLDEADPDEAIYKQLNGEDTDDMDTDSRVGDEDTRLESLAQTSPSSAPTMKSFAESHGLNTNSAEYKQANGRLALKSSTSHVPVPQVPRSNKQIPPPKDLYGHVSTTPIPVPQPVGSDTFYSPRRSSDSRSSISQDPVSSVSRSDQKTPKPKSFEGKHSTTPIPVPTWPRPKTQTPASPPQPKPTTPQHHGFTPAGRSSGTFSESAVEILNYEQPPPRPRHSRKKPKPAVEDQVWVVKGLEGDKVVKGANGRPERYFKVRWEGDWPADQNPTWEPEGNIAPPLVKKYLQKKSKSKNGSGGKAGGTAPVPPPPSSALKRKYSSVAEAFEGETETETLPQRPSSPPNDADGEEAQQEAEQEEDGEDELLLVTENSRRSSPMRTADFNAALARDLASSFHHHGNAGLDHGSPGF
ncbi:hypothetical protein F4779DRAFT_606181 [Xylariaceae sp. FL0662B]|nr:hypothetical protein F4779DRAFT_606181 [Xylariaceae sp. FL0662B]